MIGLDLGFQIDSKNISSQINKIRDEINNGLKAGQSLNLTDSIQQAKILQKAMARATGADGTVSFVNLNTELRKMGTTAGGLAAQLSVAGSGFAQSMSAANQAITFANRSSLVLSDRIHTIAHTIKQSFKYSMAQALFRQVSKFATQSIHWVKDLNESVNKIGVVTGKTASELDRVTTKIVKSAKELKVAAKDYADASFIFYQQGLGDQEVERRTEITIKAARAAGQEVSTMSEQLTAVWNTYKMSTEQQANAASVGAKLAASTAAEFSDISSAMQLSAAAAEQMGVSYNSLAAIIATVKDTTQQSASIIGNAYKTIFSRFEQLKSAGTDGEVTLGQVSKQLQNLGVNVLDSAGNLRQLEQVINEVGKGWDKFTEKQQLAIAQAVGGTRQYGQFLALMNNFDKYQKNLAIANAESGTETLDQQYQKTLDSLDAIQKRTKETFSRAGSNILNEDFLKDIWKIFQGIGEAVEGVSETIGGIPGMLALVGVALQKRLVPMIDGAITKTVTLSNSLTKDGRQRNAEKFLTDRRNAVNTMFNNTPIQNTTMYDETLLAKERLEYQDMIYRKEGELQEKIRGVSEERRIELRIIEEQYKKTQEILDLNTANMGKTRAAAYSKLNGDFFMSGVVPKQEMNSLFRAADANSYNAAVRAVNSELIGGPQLAELKQGEQLTLQIKVANEQILASYLQQADAYQNLTVKEQAAVDNYMKITEETSLHLGNIEAINEQLDRVVPKTQNLKEAVSTLNKNYGAGIDKTTIMANTLGGVLKTVSGISMGYISITNLARVFSEETSTTLEKMSALAFTLPMAVTSFKAIGSIFTSFNNSTTGLALANIMGLVGANGEIAKGGASLGIVKAAGAGIGGLFTGKGFTGGIQNKMIPKNTILADYLSPYETNLANAQAELVKKQAALNSAKQSGMSSSQLKGLTNEVRLANDAKNRANQALINAQTNVPQATQDMIANAEAAELAAAKHAAFAAKIAIATAAIAAIIAAFVIYEKIIKKNYEEAQKHAQKVSEAADNIAQQTSSLRDNVKAWREATIAGEGAADAFSKVSNSLVSLSKSLEDAGLDADLYISKLNKAIASGDQDKINAAIEEMETATQQANIKAQADQIAAANRYQKQTIFHKKKGIDADTGYAVLGQNLGDFYDNLSKLEERLRIAQANGETQKIEGLRAQIKSLKEEWSDEIDMAEKAMSIGIEYYNELVDSQKDALNSLNYEQSLGVLQSYANGINDMYGGNLGESQIASMLKTIATGNSNLSRAIALNETIASYGPREERTLGRAESGKNKGEVEWITKEVEGIENFEQLQELVNKMSREQQDIFLDLNKDLYTNTEQIKKSVDAIQAYRKELKNTFETQSQLKDIISKNNTLQKGLDAAIKEMQDEDRGYVTDDTAEELINSGLSQYLTEVEGKFYLTKGAANAFNSSLKEEHEAVKRLFEQQTDLRVSINDMNEALIELTMTDGDLKESAQSIFDLGKAFVDSEGSLEDFGNYLTNIRASLKNLPKEIKGNEVEFNSLAKALNSGLIGALNAASVSLDSGAINFSQYLDVVKQTGEVIKSLPEELRKDFDEDSFNFLNDAISNFAKTMEENVDTLLGIFNEDYSLKIGVEINQKQLEAAQKMVQSAMSAINAYGQAASDHFTDDVMASYDRLASKGMQAGTFTAEQLKENATDIATVAAGVHAQMETAIQEVGNSIADVITNLVSSLNSFEATFSLGTNEDGKIVLKGKASVDTDGITAAAQRAGSAISSFLGLQYGNTVNGTASLLDFSGSRTKASGKDFTKVGKDTGSKTNADYYKPYESIERALNRLTKAAKRYKEAADDAFGATRIVALQKYEQSLQEIGRVQQQAMEIARAIAPQSKSTMENLLSKYGIGKAQYDEQGYLTNVADLRKALEDKVNNGSLKKNIGDKIQDAIDDVLEDEDKITETFDSMLSNIRDWMANKLEIVKQQIERAEKIADTEIKRFEMMNDLLGDLALSDGSAFKNLKSIFEQNVSKSTSISTATDRLLDIQRNIESGSKHEQWFRDTFGNEAWDAYISGNGAVPAELENMLREQLESLMDLATEMKQNLADMFEAFRDTLQFFLDQYDDISKEMKNNFQSLDRLEAIMDATSFGKTKEGLETKAEISKAREEQTRRDIDLAMSKRNVAKEAMDQAEAVMKAAMNGKKSIDDLTDAEKIAYDLARKNFNEARDTFYQTEEDLTEALNNGLEQAKETLEIMNQLAEKTFSDQIGGFSLDSLKDEYDMQKTMDNFYLDAYEKEYSLSKLENEIAEQMKDVDDPSRLKAWGEFQDKLNGLRENGVNITQDEYEILEAEFELEKLRDQYEEAKNAKNTMRLARDASGNYSYVYSSNSKEVNKLAQQIKDAEHNIYEMHKRIEQEMQDSWWELQEWYKNNIENFDKELYETDAKYKAYIDAGQAYYEMMNARYAGQITTHTDAIGIKFEETATGKVLPACQTMDQAAHDFKVAFCGEDGNGGYKGALISANNDYLESVKSLAKQFGIEMKDMRQTAEAEIDKINEKNDELIDKLTGKEGVEAAAKKALESAGKNLKSFVTNEFLPNMQKILDKIAEVTKALNDFESRKSGSVNTETPETPEIPETPETPGTPGTPGTPSSNDWQKEWNNAKAYSVDQIKTVQKAMGFSGSDVDGSWGPKSQEAAQKKYGTISFAKIWADHFEDGGAINRPQSFDILDHTWGENKLNYSEWELIPYGSKQFWHRKNSNSNTYYDSGDTKVITENGVKKILVPANTAMWGYKATASGGLISTPQIRSLAEEGPELVLNAEDTKNILATVKMMREVVARQSNAIRGTDFASRVSSDFFNQHQTVDQDVKIEATFPNVSMASEIEAAFNNLINEAVQYATRR